MSRFWQIISLIFVVTLASCASNEQVYRAEDNSAPEEVAAAEIERQEQEAKAKMLEMQQKEEAEAREAERQLEVARVQAEQEAAREAESARQQQLADQQRRSAEQARARQQAEVDELRAKINANNAETANFEAANESLREAITTAEELSGTLNSEQQKYSNTDPVTGKTLEGLATATIDELSAEIERLREQAAILQAASQ